MWKGESETREGIVQGFSPISVNNKNSGSLEQKTNFYSSNKLNYCSYSSKTSRHYHRRHFVHWFRKGLRLSDNPALLRGLRKATSFRCIFILDPWFAGKSNVGFNKWRFLLQSLEDLDLSLRKLNSRLFVIRGQPADVLPSLFKEWKTNYFSFEEDPEPYGKIRDDKIIAMCKDLGVHVVKESSHTLYNLNKIIDKNGGRTPLTYRQFVHIISALGPPKYPVPAISLNLTNAVTTPIERDHDVKFGVPSLRELGFDKNKTKCTSIWPGGETEAIRQLERYLEHKAKISSFGKLNVTSQNLISSSTGLSCYLRFGCLSARLLYHSMADLFKKMKNAEPPLALFSHLLWREFFYVAAFQNPNFDRMSGNPICLQIPWDKNAIALQKWSHGKTGFPWIDAIMTQLRQEGWIHYICRHAVICFLTRGDLWISWEEGMKVFDELLLDADYSVNAGMWMWLSCSSFFQQFLHVYCPIKVGRQIDPDGDYIRRYIPILKNYPTEFIHEPWKAPEDVQQQVGCVIGVDYPVPIVNHENISKINEARLRQVFEQLSSYRMFNLHNALLERTPDQEVLKIEQAFKDRTEHVQILIETEEKNKVQTQENLHDKEIQKLVMRQQLKRTYKKESNQSEILKEDYVSTSKGYDGEKSQSQRSYSYEEEEQGPSQDQPSPPDSKDNKDKESQNNEEELTFKTEECELKDHDDNCTLKEEDPYDSCLEDSSTFRIDPNSSEQELQIFIKALEDFQTTPDILSRPHTLSTSLSIDFDTEIDKILESIKSEKCTNY